MLKLMTRGMLLQLKNVIDNERYFYSIDQYDRSIERAVCRVKPGMPLFFIKQTVVWVEKRNNYLRCCDFLTYAGMCRVWLDYDNRELLTKFTTF